MMWPPADPVAVQKLHGSVTVDLWLWDCRENVRQLASLERLLSADESARNRSFRSNLDRMRYTIAHGLLRRTLGAYLESRPESIVLRRGALGRPYVVQSTMQDSIYFSLSRSGELGLLAVSRSDVVGVDLQFAEVLRDGTESLILSDEEQAMLHGTPPSERHAAILRCWVRKEALLKAEGCGLTVPMRTFSVLGSSGDGVPADISRRWILTDLDICQGYVGALASTNGKPALRCYRLV